MINIDGFVAQFKDQYFDAAELQMDAMTEFRRIESWDSLTGMAILVMVKDEFNIDFPEDKFRGCNTVQEVYDEVNKMVS